MAKEKFSPDELISTAQAAAELGISVSRMLILISTERLPAKRIGNFWTVRYADLDLVRDRPPGRPRKKLEEEAKKGDAVSVDAKKKQKSAGSKKNSRS